VVRSLSQNPIRVVLPSATNRSVSLADMPCNHNRTQLIAKDKDAVYVECLDCGVILESSEETEQHVDGSLADA
jgi:hypothetical protein